MLEYSLTASILDAVPMLARPGTLPLSLVVKEIG